MPPRLYKHPQSSIRPLCAPSLACAAGLLATAVLAGPLGGCAHLDAQTRRPDQGARPANPLALPTLIVPHPTRGILHGLLHMRVNKQIPRAHYIFIVHQHQRYDFDDLASYVRQRGFRSFEIITLRELPIHLPESKAMAPDPKRHPDAWILRVRLTPRLYLPASWRRLFRDLVNRADAVIIPGGGSIPASFYRAEQLAEHLSSQPVRAVFEVALLRFLLDGPEAYLIKRPRFLVLGLCHGHQLLNVALGGTLYQSIPMEIYKQRYVQEILDGDPDNMHRNYRLALYPTVGGLYMGWFHPIRVTGESRFFLPQGRAYVLSNHHQAIRQVGLGLKVVAVSQDGRVIEGIQHRFFPHVVGVQGHPEYQFAWQRLAHFGPATVAFHKHLWRQVREVLHENHKWRRRHRGKPPLRGRGDGAQDPRGAPKR